jgi:quercetin 2,3-dioxygenase
MQIQLLQLWFSPNEKKVTPSYEDISYDVEQLEKSITCNLPYCLRAGGRNPSRFNPLLIKIRWKENTKLSTGRRQEDLHLYYRRGNFN